MTRPRHTAIGSLLVGIGCLSAGLALGRWLPRSNETVWSGADQPLATPPTSFADVAAKVAPGVVTLRSRMPALSAPAVGSEVITDATVEPTTPAGTGRPVATTEAGYRNGSGFVVNARGLVLTSRHVVMGASEIEVLVPGRGRYGAEVIGEDAATDLALVRLVQAPLDLTVLEMGRSEELRAGDWIVAVGNPFGFSQTVTAGVVSYVGRHLPHSDFALTNDFLQFSAPVNPGSSGCPVLDLHGRVVGVTTQAAAAAQGISFAVPSRTVKWTLDAMGKSLDGRVRRGYLGIEFASRGGVTDDGQRLHGAVVIKVAEGQPAARAGVRAGDVVLRVDGQAVEDATVLHEHIVRGDPGHRIALTLLRDGRVQDPIEAVLGEVGGAKSTAPAN
ncbi:MAG: trypsin-like peptidase domain-containing protein [Planctomycetes bacterium]|nr:trypsin-like peptidase domain-containing protein [Planctomycetota bacterium]MCC7062550.1 trypsin-like peptidase domain-containing protein [Planctomycetota bacterium]